MKVFQLNTALQGQEALQGAKQALGSTMERMHNYLLAKVPNPDLGWNALPCK